MVISLVAGPCCLVLSAEFLIVIAGCAVLCSHAAGFAMFLVQFCWLALFFMAGFCPGYCLFRCSSASCFYSWWLGFGFKTLACPFACMVRLLASGGWVRACFLAYLVLVHCLRASSFAWVLLAALACSVVMFTPLAHAFAAFMFGLCF